MNDIAVLTSILGVLGTASGILFGYLAFSRNRKSDDQKDAAQMTTLLVKLENISNGIAEIKAEMGSMKGDIKEARERLITVEQSVKAAWKRIEALENGGMV